MSEYVSKQTLCVSGALHDTLDRTYLHLYYQFPGSGWWAVLLQESKDGPRELARYNMTGPIERIRNLAAEDVREELRRRLGLSSEVTELFYDTQTLEDETFP